MGIFNTSPTDLLARVIVFFAAITIHEYAHGFVAYKLGDPTAKYAGRLTLNPISHFDPIGAVCMALFGFGWAKPVPVNPMYFKNRKRDNALVALAGPVTNILFAFVFLIFTALFSGLAYPAMDKTIARFILDILIQFSLLNLSFAVFNLIPIPPLDGSKILGAFLSQRNYTKLLLFESIGFPILMILSFTGVLGMILEFFLIPLIELWEMCYEVLLSIM